MKQMDPSIFPTISKDMKNGEQFTQKTLNFEVK